MQLARDKPGGVRFSSFLFAWELNVRFTGNQKVEPNLISFPQASDNDSVGSEHSLPSTPASPEPSSPVTCQPIRRRTVAGQDPAMSFFLIFLKCPVQPEGFIMLECTKSLVASPTSLCLKFGSESPKKKNALANESEWTCVLSSKVSSV